jgi:hypothetical protein
MVPAETKITIVFDGSPERGIRGERIASGLTVQYGGRYSADTILVTLVEDAAMGGDVAAAQGTLVVTDDRELGEAIRRRGARTAGTSWLIGRLDRPRLASPSIGNARPPTSPNRARANRRATTTARNQNAGPPAAAQPRRRAIPGASAARMRP